MLQSVNNLALTHFQVSDYVSHLRRLEQEAPYSVVAYIYHLYMGLLSGGQVLKAKRRLLNPLTKREANSTGAEACPGEAVTHFGGMAVSALKKKVREAAERVADGVDEETKEAIVLEGVKVFQLNNTLVRSVRGVDDVFYRKVITWVTVLAVIISIILAIMFNW